MSVRVAPNFEHSERLNEIVRKLQEPFHPSKIQWRASILSRDKKSALATPYIDARDIMWRLDKTVGAFNWQNGKVEFAGGVASFGLAIRHPELMNEWVWRWDLGVTEKAHDKRGAVKMTVLGSSTVGVRRAAMLWGIGRYLYYLPKTWVPYNPESKKLLEIPALPNWALPYAMQKENGGQTGPPENEPSEPIGDAIDGADPDAPEDAIEDEPAGPPSGTNKGDVLNYAFTELHWEPKQAREWVEEKEKQGKSHEEMRQILEATGSDPKLPPSDLPGSPYAEG